MKSFVYQIHADWDPEAEVWVATSEDVPGLVVTLGPQAARLL